MRIELIPVSSFKVERDKRINPVRIIDLISIERGLEFVEFVRICRVAQYRGALEGLE